MLLLEGYRCMMTKSETAAIEAGNEEGVQKQALLTLQKGWTTVVYLSMLMATVRQMEPVNPTWAMGSITGTRQA